MNKDIDERLLELMSDKAASGLSEAEQTELLKFEASDDSYDLAAAAIALAELDLDEAMPANLEARILADSERHFEQADTSQTVFEMPKQKGSFVAWLGWALAAAALIALGTNVYLTRKDASVIGGVTPTPSPVKEMLTPVQQRDQLMATAADLTRAEWSKGTMPELQNATVTGTVVWSDAKQAGYMTLKGLPINDANLEAYQLWIFDETQSDKTPIDGGVFNVTADGDVVIPINAKLRARNPKMFAITMEKPGGVVVSERKKVAALAAVKPGEA